MKSKPIIGIVGGVGAGKSTVARAFAALGCPLIDADRIGHELLREPDVKEQVRSRWSGAVFTPGGEVSRPALAEAVFADPAELAKLNAILHPRIRRRLAERIAEVRADASAAGAVLDAAVMFEAGWDDLCTVRVFVSAPKSERLARVAGSRGWNRQQWQVREKSQNSLDSKASKCEYTVDNRYGASFLREQVRVIFHRIRQED